MVASMMITASAADISTAGGTGNTPVELTAAATTFSVIVPTSIAINVNADGTVTCPSADAVKIVNNSAGPVKVTQIDMNNGTWSLVSYNGGDRTTMAAAGVDSKKLGFQMTANTDVVATATDGNQTLTHTVDKWIIGGKDSGANELTIATAAIATAVSTAITEAESAATIVFTLAWNS